MKNQIPSIHFNKRKSCLKKDSFLFFKNKMLNRFFHFSETHKKPLENKIKISFLPPLALTCFTFSEPYNLCKGSFIKRFQVSEATFFKYKNYNSINDINWDIYISEGSLSNKKHRKINVSIMLSRFKFWILYGSSEVKRDLKLFVKVRFWRQILRKG